jgi:rhodanese-related sulfurtransferase
MRIAGLALAFGLAAALLAGAQDYGTPDGLQKLIAENSAGQGAGQGAGKGVPYFLVDVRTAEEFDSGYIPTAVNIPYDTILQKPPTRDKAALIVVYCRSGSRSAMAYRALIGAGYTNVVNFGAIGRWKGEIVKP